jgi:hypothetical protein
VANRRITEGDGMELDLKINPQVSGYGEIYEVSHAQQWIGRIWERPTSIAPEKRWGWMVLQTQKLGPIMSPSGMAATLEQAKAALRETFIF